jgi:hypothetical protein
MAKRTDPYDFFLAPVATASDGSLSTTGYINLEDTFVGLRYKSITGLESLGVTNNYVEKYAESDEAKVYVPQNAPRQSVDIRLTVYIFSPTKGDYAGQISMIETIYNDFLNFIDNKKMIYYDTARLRKCFMYQDGAIAPKEMKLKGHPYFEVDIPFKSVYGHASIEATHTYADITGDTAYIPTKRRLMAGAPLHLEVSYDFNIGKMYLTCSTTGDEDWRLTPQTDNVDYNPALYLYDITISCSKLGVKNCRLMFDIYQGGFTDLDDTAIAGSVTDYFDGYNAGKNGLIERWKINDIIHK